MSSLASLYRRFRLLPITMVIAFAALLLRFQTTTQDAQRGLFITTSFVQADDKPSPDVQSADDKKSAAAPDVQSADDKDKKPDDKSADKDKAGDKTADDKDKKADATPPAPKDPLSTEGQEMRPTEELKILQDLADRRKQLDDREATIGQREALEQASEKQFAEKLKELTALRDEIKQLVTAATQKENDESQKLVTIYEKMKPKDAAGIFSTMSPDVLFPIIQGMKETKLSPILASMPPDKAKQITDMLEQHAKILPSDTPARAAAATSGVNPAAAPPAQPTTPGAH